MEEERVSIPGSGAGWKDTENRRGSCHSSEGRRTSEKREKMEKWSQGCGVRKAGVKGGAGGGWLDDSSRGGRETQREGERSKDEKKGGNEPTEEYYGPSNGKEIREKKKQRRKKKGGGIRGNGGGGGDGGGKQRNGGWKKEEEGIGISRDGQKRNGKKLEGGERRTKDRREHGILRSERPKSRDGEGMKKRGGRGERQHEPVNRGIGREREARRLTNGRKRAGCWGR